MKDRTIHIVTGKEGYEKYLAMIETLSKSEQLQYWMDNYTMVKSRQAEIIKQYKDDSKDTKGSSSEIDSIHTTY